MARKTIKVEEILDYVNGRLDYKNIHYSQVEKRTMCLLLEHFLQKTGNYKGFNYTYWLDKGCAEWQADGEPDFPKKDKYLGESYSRIYHK